MCRNIKTLTAKPSPATPAGGWLAALAVLGLACFVQAAAAQAQGAPGPTQAYDPLPDESPALLSELFYAAGEVPGVAELPPAAKLDLLAVVTERYGRRLANRASDALPEQLREYMEGLSQSELAQAFPEALRQACAQQGFAEGPCAPHSGYVRRALVLEEMLAGQRLSLEDLQAELAAAKPL